MIVCPHEGCGYAVGWTHRNGDDNLYLDPPEGDFFEVSNSIHEGAAYRWDDSQTGIRHMRVLGCPKCFRMFINKDQVYKE